MTPTDGPWTPEAVELLKRIRTQGLYDHLHASRLADLLVAAGRSPAEYPIPGMRTYSRKPSDYVKLLAGLQGGDVDVACDWVDAFAKKIGLNFHSLLVRTDLFVSDPSDENRIDCPQNFSQALRDVRAFWTNYQTLTGNPAADPDAQMAAETGPIFQDPYRFESEEPCGC